MKLISIRLLIILFIPLGFNAQSIVVNSISGVNPNLSDPYSNGQIVNSDCSCSGISRGSGIFGKNANNRYNATSWNSVTLDTNKYFEFIITPNLGKEIDFVSFIFKGQISLYGPTAFAFRSSLDGFSSNIGTINSRGSIVLLTNAIFQNATTAIVFRLYAWGATKGTGTFSINDFKFNGNISCSSPQVPILQDVLLGCKSTEATLNWPLSLSATNYFIDVASDYNFINIHAGYNNTDLGNTLSSTVFGLIAGETYFVRLRCANDCAITSYSKTIKIAPLQTVYNGSWSNGTPDETKSVRFSKDFNLSSTFEACSCQIDEGVAVIVESESVLSLENSLKVIGSGTLTFENNASLIQINDLAVNTGEIIYKRNSSPMNDFDYTDWCSPVQGQTLKKLSPNTLSDKYYSFKANNWVLENPDNSMTLGGKAGKGYTIRTPKAGLWPNGENVVFPYTQSVAFKGVPNNGVYTYPIEGGGYYNFIGNPYPSALDADTFLITNMESKAIRGTIYIWTHNTPINNNVYDSDDYASYNIVGGVRGKKATSTGDNGVIPAGQIAAGQGFYVISETGNSGTITFDNSMRIGASGSNSQFFKGAKTKMSVVEKHRVWLSLSNDKGVYKQMLVGYIDGATNGKENAFDGLSFNKNTYVDFYSLIDAKKYVIQGRALPFDKNDRVPLGYKSTLQGEFAITIDQTDGALGNQPVFLEDKLTGKVHNLKNGAYSFTTQIGTFDDRFTLVYFDKTDPTLANLGYNKSSKELVVSLKNHQIKINSFEEVIDKINLYDLQGRILYKRDSLNKNEHTISIVNENNQLLIVVVEFTNGTKQSKQIIY